MELTPIQRLEAALASDSPAAAAYTLALQLRDEGMAQADLMALYVTFQNRHYDDEDETQLEAILDTMDDICGSRPGWEFYK